MNENENEKEFVNVFRFSLTQGDILLCEKLFDADDFNPFTRYSIDIRDILPRAITRLQKTLSKRSYDVIAEVGRQDVSGVDTLDEDVKLEMVTYNLLKYHQEMINSYPQRYRSSMRYAPTPIVQQIEEKTIRGVECKIGLYINNNPIVERLFYVDGFNPVARQSLDLTYVVTDIADTIAAKIKRNDIRNMWDDYDLINMRGLSINQIRELPIGKREYLIRQLRR
jgi:hypothetical protein